MDELRTFLEAFKGIADIPDDQLTDDMLKNGFRLLLKNIFSH